MPNSTNNIQTVSVNDFKKSAKRLATILKEKDLDIKHSESLELMANINGHKDYNTFIALAKKENEKPYIIL